MAYTKYSLTPANNNAAPPDGAPEGMLPSAVNDTMRDMMAQIRDVGDGIRGGTYTMTAPVITGGSITGVALSGNTLTSPVITGGSINNTPIGASTANTGAFTTLGATGVATFSAGSVSAPAITTTGDTNTGIFFPAADTIAFTEGGVESMRIDASGNMGIGTTSPSSIGTNYTTLDIRGSAGGGLRFGVSASTSNFQMYTDATNVQMYTAAAIPIVISNNNIERMRITSGGDVGIGLSSPGGRFDIAQVSRVRWDLSNDYVYQSVINAAGNAYKANIVDASQHQFYYSGVEAMRITTAGNVGIGTISPSRRLQVSQSNATTYASDFDNTPNQLYLVNTNTTTNAYTGLQMDVGGNSQAAISAVRVGDGEVAMTFSSRVAGTRAERMRIDSSGNLLVGKSASNNTTSGLQLDSFSGNAGRVTCVKSASGSFSVWSNFHSGTYVGGIDMSNTATGFPTSSDVRLKKNIQEAPSALDRVNQMRIVSHDWKIDDSHVEFGVIAQELQPIAPQAVKFGDDGEEVKDTWSVDYSKLVPILTKAIQEQQQIINDLKARIETLESK
jgi:hypothetical protein